MAEVAADPFDYNRQMEEYARGVSEEVEFEVNGTFWRGRPGSIFREIARERDIDVAGRNAVQIAKEIFENVKDGGTLGIKYSYAIMEPRRHGTKTACDVWEDRSGDCNEMAALYTTLVRLAGISANIGLVGTGYADVDIDYAGEDVSHGCAVLFIRGDVPAKYAYRDFERDKEFRKYALGKAGLKDEKDLHMVLVDLTYGQFGAQHRKIGVLSDAEAKVVYYIQVSADFAGQGRFTLAKEALQKARQIAKGSGMEADVLMAESARYEERGMDFRSLCSMVSAISSALRHREWREYAQDVKPTATEEDTMRRYESALKKHEGHEAAPRVHVEVGDYYYRKGEHAKALGHFEKALAKKPKLLGANFYAGMCCFEREDFAKGVKFFERVVALDNKHESAHYYLGLCYLKSGQYGKAEKEFKEVLRLAPDFPYAKYNLALAKLRGGAKEVAKHLEQRVRGIY